MESSHFHCRCAHAAPTTVRAQHRRTNRRRHHIPPTVLRKFNYSARATTKMHEYIYQNYWKMCNSIDEWF